jgi:hypothetical protein
MKPVFLIVILILLVLSILLGYFIYLSIFFVHEEGHSVFAFNNTNITNWEKDLWFNIIDLPQQTEMIEGRSHLLFAYGGMIFSILFYTTISLIFYIKVKNNLILFIPPLITANELVGNFICGTDNTRGQPLLMCSGSLLEIFTRVVPFLLMIILFLIIFSELRNRKLLTSPSSSS